MRLTCGNTYMCESTYIFYDEASQIYSENINWMADETLLCMTHSRIFPFLVLKKCCESVVLYIILMEVARKLSRFCKMARSRRWKVDDPRWI